MTTPQLSWMTGTAYDLFMSLNVLHSPANYGLRASWAAGMRSRLPTAEREILEQVHSGMAPIPFTFLYDLPDPRDGASAINAMSELPPVEVVRSFFEFYETPAVIKEYNKNIVARGSHTDEDVSAYANWLKEEYANYGKTPHKEELEGIPRVLGWWAQPETFSRRYLDGLEAYYDVFFAEEERRIKPFLDAGLERAQKLSKEMSVPDLLEELSQGVHLPESTIDVEKMAIAPSYWCTPFIHYPRLSEEMIFIMFGARPADAALVPGDVVPATLTQVLKALSDPTRLKIMRYLSSTSMTPSQLARRLRLRPPTVIHHLNDLRVAGLVQIKVSDSKEKLYAARPTAIDQACATLNSFLNSEPLEEEEEA
jgi:DNA-binding transcriptional ArsR family regulator